ncbi:MAG TPA: glycosyl hydrolase 108 family protein [Chitinophagaceae bacterium]|nr:glycosyl hydrolase 108 family protein [Chitinophagaceae bacterium]
MASFDESYKKVRQLEGGYANDPDDTGGETYKGISRRNFPGWGGWQHIDTIKAAGKNKASLDELLESQPALQEMVLAFYKKEFWDVLNLDNFRDQRIATEVFDTGVNMGTYIAAVFLQKTLNVLNRNQVDYADLPVTGKVGALTTEAVNLQQRPDEVLKVLNCLQGSRYVEICLANAKQEKFLRSWLNRITI